MKCNGETIQIQALRSDRTPYRWWESKIEDAGSHCIITSNQIGDLVYEPEGHWKTKLHSRAYYWTDRPLNVIEVYSDSGEPVEIYINIASPFQVEGEKGSYIDYELDVSLKRGHPIEILDEDEFLAAIDKYGYTSTLVNECRSSLQSAIRLAERWPWTNDVNHLRYFGEP